MAEQTKLPAKRAKDEQVSPELRILLGVSGEENLDTGLQPASGQSRTELRSLGRQFRSIATRTSQGNWSPTPARPDPIQILRRTNKGRRQELVPIRHGRMMASRFAFLRGSPAMMACDLSTTPTTGVRVQACGDAHISNFGIFGSPERRLVFDVNDFDETLPAPWEWDLKRLAASTVVAARENGMSDDDARNMAVAVAATYRAVSAELAKMAILDIWNASIDVDRIAQLLDTPRRKGLEKSAAKARRHTSMQALKKLTVVDGGELRIRDDPPLVVHQPNTDDHAFSRRVLDRYIGTLSDDKQHLLANFGLVDVARKVVGVGSVGTRCFIVLLSGKTDGSPLFLQVKQATQSVLEPYAGPSKKHGHAKRVVDGQVLMQAASDPFLGYVSANRRDFYVRQLRDMKGSADVSRLVPEGFLAYVEVCATALARAHARTCHPAITSGYMGSSERFDCAIGDFAVAYADQNEADYEAFLAAVRSGRIDAETEV